MMLAVSEASCDEKKVMASSSSSKSSAENGAHAAVGEPVLAEVEYVLSEDLKDVSNVDSQLEVSILSEVSS